MKKVVFSYKYKPRLTDPGGTITMPIVTNNLVEDNLKLVYFVIEEFTNKQYTKDNILLDEDDLFQIGCLGLTKAAGSYDEGKGSFSSYAVTCIRNEIYWAFKQQGRHEDTSDFSFDKGEAFENEASLFESPGAVDAQIMLDDLINDLTAGLSKKFICDAKPLLELLSMGYKVGEAAKLIGIKEARAYKIIQKIKHAA